MLLIVWQSSKAFADTHALLVILHMLNLDSLILFLPLEKGKMLQGAIVVAAVLSLCRKVGTINIGQAGSKRSHEA